MGRLSVRPESTTSCARGRDAGARAVYRASDLRLRRSPARNRRSHCLQWEKQRIALTIDVPNSLQRCVDQMRKDLLGWPGFSYQNWQNAAQFCADNKINLDEALVWADKAISETVPQRRTGTKDFSTLKTKAAVLRAMGRDADADGVMDEAVAMADAPVMGIHQHGTSLLAAGRNGQGDDDLQAESPAASRGDVRHLRRPGAGLRGARRHQGTPSPNWEIAIRNIPDNQKANLPVYEAEQAPRRKGLESRHQQPYE